MGTVAGWWLSPFGGWLRRGWSARFAVVDGGSRCGSLVARVGPNPRFQLTAVPVAQWVAEVSLAQPHVNPVALGCTGTFDKERAHEKAKAASPNVR